MRQDKGQGLLEWAAAWHARHPLPTTARNCIPSCARARAQPPAPLSPPPHTHTHAPAHASTQPQRAAHQPLPHPHDWPVPVPDDCPPPSLLCRCTVVPQPDWPQQYWDALKDMSAGRAVEAPRPHPKFSMQVVRAAGGGACKGRGAQLAVVLCTSWGTHRGGATSTPPHQRVRTRCTPSCTSSCPCSRTR